MGTQVAVRSVNDLTTVVSRVYHHAAGGELSWKQEKAFFEAQVKRLPAIARAVRNGQQLTIESLQLAARECAAMGLSMSPNAQLVYFIPRRIRKIRQGEPKSDYERDVPMVVTATPSYRGLAYIATHFAGAKMLASEVVYAADDFEYRGPLEKPHHVPTLDNNQRNYNKAIGVYAIAKMDDGEYRCEYVDAPTVEKIRQMSEMPNSTMWNPNKLWTEGWRKVPIRRICKTVMVTDPRMSQAVENLNAVEGIVLDSSERQDEPERKGGMAGLGEALNGADEPIEGEIVDTFVPAASDNPPGSIEWWWDQMADATDLARMDEIRAAALTDGVDQSEDADEFRRIYSERMKIIKAAA